MPRRTKPRKTPGGRARRARSQVARAPRRSAAPGARISAADPLRDLCRAYRRIRSIVRALHDAEVLSQEQQMDLRLFMAMMDVLCGAAASRKRRPKERVRKR